MPALIQDTLLPGDMPRAPDIGNPTAFPSNLHGLSSAQFAQLSHQRLLQQQALSQQPGHQAIAAQHPQPGQPFGPMLSYNSSPLDGSNPFLLQSGASQHGLGLAQRMGQQQQPPQQQPSHMQVQSPNRDFNPTVGARPPGEAGKNFGEAPSVQQIPLMEPYLITQIPDLHRAESCYGPRRRLLLPHGERRGPY